MSRIDEALKRVAEAAAVEARGGVGAVVRSTRRSDEATLEHYPAERSAVAETPIAPRRQEHPRRPHASRSVPPEAPAERLGPFDASFEGKLVVGERALPLSVEQYRRLAAAMHELQHV